MEKKEAKFDIIYVGAVFHLLSKKECELLIDVINQLLNKNGILFGQTVTLYKERDNTENKNNEEKAKGAGSKNPYRRLRDLHTMDSFRILLKDKGHFEDIFLEFRKDNLKDSNDLNSMYFYCKKP